MRSSRQTALLLLFISLGTTSALAQFTAGDLIVMRSAIVPLPPTGQGSHMFVYSNDGALKYSVKVDPEGTVEEIVSYGAGLFSPGHGIFRYFSNGTRTVLGNSAQRPAEFRAPHIMAFTAAGHIYAAAPGIPGQTGPEFLARLDGNGNYLNVRELPYALGRMDLAHDQCTIEASSSPIRRYDACTGQVLPSVSTTLPAGTSVSRIRILPDGGRLVTSTSGLARLSKDGIVVRTYHSLFTREIALDIDMRSFWATGPTGIEKRDIESGAILHSIPAVEGFVVTALTVIGEPRAAVAATSAIPVAQEWVLFLFAAALIAIALVRQM